MQTAEGNRRQLRVVGEGLLPSAMGGACLKDVDSVAGALDG